MKGYDGLKSDTKRILRAKYEQQHNAYSWLS